MIFARFWIKMTKSTPSQPTSIQMMTEIADQISSGEYRSFNDKYIVSNNYIPHTLVSYIFNISSIFIHMAKKLCHPSFQDWKFYWSSWDQSCDNYDFDAHQQPRSLFSHFLAPGTFRQPSFVIWSILPPPSRTKNHQQRRKQQHQQRREQQQ